MRERNTERVRESGLSAARPCGVVVGRAGEIRVASSVSSWFWFEPSRGVRYAAVRSLFYLGLWVVLGSISCRAEGFHRGAELPGQGKSGSGWSRPDRSALIWCAAAMWRDMVRDGDAVWWCSRRHGAARPDRGMQGYGWSRPDRCAPIWCAAAVWREIVRGGVAGWWRAWEIARNAGRASLNRCRGLAGCFPAWFRSTGRRIGLAGVFPPSSGLSGYWAWASALGSITCFVFFYVFSVFVFSAVFVFVCLGLESGFICRILNKLGVSRVAGSSIRHHVWEAVVYLTLGLCKRVTHDCFFPSMSLEANRVPIVGVLFARWCIVVYRCVMESHDIISGLCIQGFRFYVPPLYSAILLMEA